MALTRLNRLRLEKDIKNIFKKGRTVKETPYLVKFVPNKLNNPRISVSVPKKVSKSAVARVGIKRVVLAMIQNELNDLPNADILLIVLPEYKDMDKKESRAVLNRVLDKLKKK